MEGSTKSFQLPPTTRVFPFPDSTRLRDVSAFKLRTLLPIMVPNPFCQMLGGLVGEVDGEVDGEADGEADGEVDSEVDGEADGKVDGESGGRVVTSNVGSVEGDRDGVTVEASLGDMETVVAGGRLKLLGGDESFGVDGDIEGTIGAAV